MFNKIVVLIVSLAVFASCAKKEESAFTIRGSISPATTNYVVLKQQTDIERKNSTAVDTIYIAEDGSFKKNFDLEPHLYILQIDNKKSVKLAVNKGENIVVDIYNFNNPDYDVSIKGSEDTDALHSYENFRLKSLDTLVKSVRRQIKTLKKSDNPAINKINELGELEIKNYEIHLAELNDYISKNMKGSLALYATSIRWKGEENLKLYDDLVSSVEVSYPNLDITTKLREKVTRLQQTSIGGIAPEIAMNNPQNKEIRLSSVNEKYTLIDFWASWCGPCRRESEGLNYLYEKYKDKGFEIYGVSLDDNGEKWLSALEKDNRIWHNVSSLERFKTPAAFDYAVTALPDNYIIDGNGKIVAKNIHGEELEALLNKLMSKN